MASEMECAAARCDSPELAAPKEQVTTRVYITLWPDSLEMPCMDDPGAWDAHSTVLFVGGPGRVGQTCGVLGDFSTQLPVSLKQLDALVNLLDMLMPDKGSGGARIESLTVNLAGCAACAMRACVKLAPGTLVLLCDHLLCSVKHAHRRAPVRLKWWQPRGVVVAPRNLLTPRYSLDREDVLAVAQAHYLSYRNSKLSFANYPIRLFDVPRSRSGQGDAYFFVQWCASQLLPKRVRRVDESTRNAAERAWALRQLLAVRKEAERVAGLFQQPVDVMLARGVYIAPLRRHGTASCLACGDDPSYLGLADVLAYWLDVEPPLTWRCAPTGKTCGQ